MITTNGITTRIYVYDKRRALRMADYLSEYGLEVEEVTISTDGRCEICVWGDNNKIFNCVEQFNEDYGNE